MVARFTQLTFSPANVENAKAVYYAKIAPVIRSFAGNIQVMLLEPQNTAEEFISFSLWESEDDLQAFESSAEYQPVIKKIKDLAEKAVPKYYHVEKSL